MNKDFILPDIGEGIVVCEVIEWTVKEGDQIEEDQIVVDVSTDKAIVEIPSMYTGRITKLYYREADIAKVHQPLFAIEVDGDLEVSAEQQKQVLADPSIDANRPVIGEPTLRVVPSKATVANSNGNVLSTPAVRSPQLRSSRSLPPRPATRCSSRRCVMAYICDPYGEPLLQRC